MSAPAYRIIDRRGQGGGYSSNRLYRASRQTDIKDRQLLSDLNRDAWRNISPSGRKQLVTIGRFLYANFAPIRAAVNEAADYASQGFVPQFCGKDKAWGGEAEEWLYEHDKIADIRGNPYSMQVFRRNLALASMRDGDMATLLVGEDGEYPLIQPIGCHRVTSDASHERVVGGEFDGAFICDGVITNDYGRAIGYRLDEPSAPGGFRDISARNMILSYRPDFTDQVRGFSAIGVAAFDSQDIQEARGYNLLAQKVAASIALIEENETGEADAAKAIVSGGASDTDGNKSSISAEQHEGGMIRYFKAGTNSKLTSFSYDRPGANSQEFESRILRAALAGMGWSVDFSLDPTKAGGAQMRVVLDKINRAIIGIQEYVLRPTLARIDGWRIAKAIKLGLLRPSPEWYKWDYTGAERPTADRKYESDVDLTEMGAGARTLKDVAAKRGGYWQDTREQQSVEVNDLLTRAQADAKKFGISIEQAITLYRTVGNYSTITNSAPEPTQTQVAA